MTQFVTAQSEAALSQDPSISLKNMLAADATTTPVGLYGSTGASSSLPAAAGVRFDTKFSRYDLHNIVIVERMPVIVEEQTLGMQRFRINEVKRVQIWCDTKQAINNRWLIEQELFRIINANPTYLQSVGIDYVEIQSGPFPIQGPVGDDSTDPEVGRPDTLSRSYFLVKVVYDVTKV